MKQLALSFCKFSPSIFVVVLLFTAPEWGLWAAAAMAILMNYVNQLNMSRFHHYQNQANDELIQLVTILEGMVKAEQNKTISTQ